MAETTGISWTDATWNPWMGCHKVSSGCAHCYAERDAKKYGRDFNKVTRSKTTFDAPRKWAKSNTLKPGSKIFVCSWSDFFISEADEWRAEAWSIMRGLPYIFQIPTKRPGNIRARLPGGWGSGWKNVWLGVTVESWKYLHRAEMLSQIPAALRFISYEPALGYVNFWPVLKDFRFQWLISGGESGPCFRLANPEWFNSVHMQCEEKGIAFFHKQNGGNIKIGGAWGGKKLFGKIYQAFPDYHL
jgi:protein gp37